MKNYNSEILIAVDGGGTKTEFVAADCKGNVLSRVLKGCGNINDIGIQRFKEMFCDGIKELLNNGGLSLKDTIGVFLGISGGGLDIYRSKIRLMVKEVLGEVPFDNNSDAVSAMSSGVPCGNAVVLIAGTGVSIYCRKKEEYHRLYGWGHLFDQGGSGYDIGRDGLRAALESHDGLAPFTLIKDLVEKKLGCSVVDALPKIYQRGKDYIASFSREVIEAYDAGDRAAVNIIEDNAANLVKMVKSGVWFLGEGSRVVLAGGLFSRADIFLPLLKRHSDEVDFILPDCKPVFGSLAEASKIAGLSYTKLFKENFLRSYNG